MKIEVNFEDINKKIVFHTYKSLLTFVKDYERFIKIISLYNQKDLALRKTKEWKNKPEVIERIKKQRDEYRKRNRKKIREYNRKYKRKLKIK